ncbi:hypothetical protein MN116_000650 [Schistosoma mekongi]|uniref:Uncharacterized protein n=1 Tax=Schistosoma mekongi TaxID=38744 RepID=A0AAE2D945_SCHME|nr:hypothetical protein MN116_000650 [Schistosoma mekongi]
MEPLKVNLSHSTDLCQKSNSILGPNEAYLTVESLRDEELQRQRLLITINQRKHQSYPVKFHYDQLLVQLMKENGCIKVNNLIVPKSTLNQQSYQWNELPNPTLLINSMKLRQIKQIHDYNKHVKLTENSLLQVTDNAVDMKKLNVDLKKTHQCAKLSSPQGCTMSKDNSSLSITSLNEEEINEAQKKLDNLQALFIQVKNQIDSSNTTDNDKEIMPNTSTEHITEHSLFQTEVESTGGEREKTDKFDDIQNLPNYATFSVEKSHQFAVRNWLLSNFNHI